MGDTPRSQTVSTKLHRIAEQAVQYPQMAFTAIIHHIDVNFLREAYRRTRKDAVPGSDGVTAAEYAKNLEENLRNLYERMRGGRYEAPPVKRAWLEKDDGSRRAIGMPTVIPYCTSYCDLLECCRPSCFSLYDVATFSCNSTTLLEVSVIQRG